MSRHKSIAVLTLVAAASSAAAASMGIFTTGGSGAFDYKSIRGKPVSVWGTGLYRHMSAGVAPQGIAQDYVTLFLAVPLLLVFLFLSKRDGLVARLLLTGTLGYILVTYLFYLAMAMYNGAFLLYVLALSSSFFAFVLSISRLLNSRRLQSRPRTYPKSPGLFLLVNAVTVSVLWLSIIIPPLLDGSIIPKETEHYTTLIVQGFDLALLLPGAIVSGILLLRNRPAGWVLATVYCIFLSLMMTALTAKLIALEPLGYTVIPAIFIIPVFALAAIVSSIILLRQPTSS